MDAKAGLISKRFPGAARMEEVRPMKLGVRVDTVLCEAPGDRENLALHIRVAPLVDQEGGEAVDRVGVGLIDIGNLHFASV